MKENLQLILSNHKITILMTFIWGVLAHGYAMTNTITYHDGLLVERVGATYISGRWFLGLLGEQGLVGKLIGTYNLPFLTGILFLIIVSATNIVLFELFDIKEVVRKIILSGVIVVFPTVISLFGYIYTLDYYALAVLMAVLAVWIVKKNRNVWLKTLLSIFCIVCSMGIYQAYAGFSITLFLLLFLDEILQDATIKFKNIILKAVYYLSILGFSYVLYMVVNKLFLKIMNVQLVDYQNLPNMGKFTVESLKQGVIKAYINFKDVNLDIFPDKAKYIYISTLIVMLVLCVLVVIKLLYDKRYIHIMFFFLAIVLLPMGLNSAYLMGSAWVYNLMLYSNAILFFVPFILLKYVDVPLLKKVSIYASCIVVGYVCVFYMTYSNRCYMDATYTQQKTISWMNQMISQIKSTEGFRDDMRIIYHFTEPIQDRTFSADTEYQVGITHYGNLDVRNSYNWSKFMRKWCGFEMPEVVGEEAATILNSEEVKNMSTYPDSGSIIIVNDVIVIKF